MTPVIPKSSSRWSLRVRDERGQALVEFAFVLFPLLLVIVATVQFGFWFQARSSLRDGVRAAARQASLCRSQTTPTPTQMYHGIVDSSLNSPSDPTILWNGSATVNCTAGTPVTVTGSYFFPINILGIVRISGTQLTATAASVVE
jgi:Flp pilus assembly protein TadG